MSTMYSKIGRALGQNKVIFLFRIASRLIEISPAEKNCKQKIKNFLGGFFRRTMFTG